MFCNHRAKKLTGVFVPTLRFSSRGPVARGPTARLRQLPLAAVVSVLCLTACTGSATRRLSESEAQGYKLQLIRSSRGQLSQDQALRFHRHPARTKKELDLAYQGAREATEAEAAVERARFDAERKADATSRTEEEETGGAEPTTETLPGEGAAPSGPGTASRSGPAGKKS